MQPYILNIANLLQGLNNNIHTAAQGLQEAENDKGLAYLWDQAGYLTAAAENFLKEATICAAMIFAYSACGNSAETKEETILFLRTLELAILAADSADKMAKMAMTIESTTFIGDAKQGYHPFDGNFATFEQDHNVEIKERDKMTMVMLGLPNPKVLN